MISHTIDAADLHMMIDGIVARETAALRRALYYRDPPGIGAVVAMVAADQQRWVVWARDESAEDWVAEAELSSRSDAMSIMAGMAASVEELRCEWKVLPEGVQP